MPLTINIKSKVGNLVCSTETNAGFCTVREAYTLGKSQKLNKMKNILLTLCILVAISICGSAQVAINETGDSPNSTSILDISSTSKGLLIPRLTTTQRNNISTPAAGLLVYDINTDSFWYYDSQWLELAVEGIIDVNGLSDGISDGSSMFLGNGSGINDDGTTNKNTAMGINSLSSNTAGDKNTAFGYVSLQNSTSGDDNTALGYISMSNNVTGADNTAVGASTLYNNNGDANTAVGMGALYGNTSGDNNTAFGTLASYSNSVGENNTAIGYLSAYSGGSGYSNVAVGVASLYRGARHNIVAIGDSALYNNGLGASSGGLQGLQNTAVGSKAMYANTIGRNNTALGFEALKNSTDGISMVAIGNKALQSLTGGYGNIAIGSKAMLSATYGYSNVFIGQSSGLYAEDVNSNVAIGYGSMYFNVNGDENTIIGANAGLGTSGTSQSGNVFIGYKAGQNELGNNKLYIENSNSSSPLIGGDFSSDRVDINGTIKITGGSPGTGKVLTSDADGDAIWEMPTTYASSLNDLTDVIHNGGSKLFVGANSGINNTGGYNTGMGYESLKLNTSGTYNNAYGYKTLDENTVGTRNTAMGHGSLGENTEGNYNTAIGYGTLDANTTGDGNTAIGYNAITSGNYSNSTAIGYNAAVNGNNQIHLGNTSVTEIKGQVNFTTYSDGRIKENIEECIAGLNFIMNLRPVTYNLNIDKENQILGIETPSDIPHKYDIEKVRKTGFIAQEVEKAANKVNYDFSGVQKPKNENDLYGLSYAEFVVPLVKGMQEQQEQINKLEKENSDLKTRLEILEKLILEK